MSANNPKLSTASPVALVPAARPLCVNDTPVAAGRLPAVCVPLMATSEEDLLRDANRAVELGADLLEWRADFFGALDQPQRVTAALLQLRAAVPTVPLIFTIRSVEQGGERHGVATGRVLDVQHAVIETRAVDFLDVELGSEPRQAETLVTAAHSKGVQVVFSQHDFAKTPTCEVIEEFFRAAQERGGDVGKVAVMPRCAEDVLTLFAATLRASRELEIPLVSMAMGPLGLASRVFAADFGSAVTFAALDRASAPGQVPIACLRALLAAFKD